MLSLVELILMGHVHLAAVLVDLELAGVAAVGIDVQRILAQHEVVVLLDLLVMVELFLALTDLFHDLCALSEAVEEDKDHHDDQDNTGDHNSDDKAEAIA